MPFRQFPRVTGFVHGLNSDRAEYHLVAQGRTLKEGRLMHSKDLSTSDDGQNAKKRKLSQSISLVLISGSFGLQGCADSSHLPPATVVQGDRSGGGDFGPDSNGLDQPMINEQELYDGQPIANASGSGSHSGGTSGHYRSRMPFFLPMFWSRSRSGPSLPRASIASGHANSNSATHPSTPGSTTSHITSSGRGGFGGTGQGITTGHGLTGGG